jgi:hypothetical protein
MFSVTKPPRMVIQTFVRLETQCFKLQPYCASTLICVTQLYTFLSYTSDNILSHSHTHVRANTFRSACNIYFGKNLSTQNKEVFFPALFFAKLTTILPARLFGQNMDLPSAHQIPWLFSYRIARGTAEKVERRQAKYFFHIVEYVRTDVANKNFQYHSRTSYTAGYRIRSIF